MADDDEVVGAPGELTARPGGQELGVAGQGLGAAAGMRGGLRQERPVEVLGKAPGQRADGGVGGVARDDDPAVFPLGGLTTVMFDAFGLGGRHRCAYPCRANLRRPGCRWSGRRRPLHRQGRAEAGIDLSRPRVATQGPRGCGDGTAHLPGDGGSGSSTAEIGGQVGGQIDGQAQGR